MELSAIVVESLTLAGDSLSIPDKLFPTLVDGAFATLLQEAPEDEKALLESLDDSTNNFNKGILKQAFFGVTTLVLEVCRHGLNKSAVSELLEGDCKWISDRIEFLTRKIEEHKALLQLHLGRIGQTQPHITDVDWRLDYAIKNSHLDKVNEPVYLIDLKTEGGIGSTLSGGGNSSSVKFTCSVNQLQDLVSKLKDASKSLEKASQS